MAPKHRDGDVVATIPGQWITHFHTVSAYAAFLGALIVGMSLHYTKIVQNEHFGYPIEWFPSVSATIGDRYPERSVFQVFIAICSGPRFLLVFLFYCMSNRPGSSLPKFVAGVGVFRTLTCGGWTYVTSTDDHDWHDIFMISYLVATLPWTLGCLALSPPNPRAIKLRKYLAGAFFGTLVPLIYFFIQHKVHRVPGAYTIYAFFEWSLVLLDVAFDAVSALDFSGFEIVVKDVKGLSRGNKQSVSDAVLEKEKDKPIGQVFDSRFSWAALLDAVADVYLGLSFWTILTGLGVVVWYFPLWYMGISGFEVAVMSTISPFLLGIGPLRRYITRFSALVLGTTVIGMSAYLFTTPVGRLGAISFSVWMASLAWSAIWYSERGNAAKLEARIMAWSIGLIASSVAKFACQTNNPFWPIMHEANGGWNKTGILLFVLAIARISRRQVGNGDASQGIEKPKGSSALAGLGLAGLLFGLHSLLSDSSTMIMWVWEGYPVQGPLSVPHGAWTILAMGAGLIFGVFYPNLTRSWTAYGIGSVGAAFLTLFSNWTGYYGALTLAFYLMALTPASISNAVRYPPGRTFFIAFFVYNIMVLFHVWVVAYAFVPGGFLVREHTDWVMATTMILIGCGVFNSLQDNAPKRQHSMRPPPNPAARKQRSYYIYILLALQLISIAVAYLRFPSYDYAPHHPESKSLNAGIWTIHFSLDNDMWSSEKRMESLLRESELDIIGLLESDQQRIIMGNRDSTQYLAEQLGMYVDAGPGPNKHTWGCALLSKFPIVNSTHHLLPSPHGELAPAIHATILAYDELIDVFVFHSGQEEDPLDRKLQMEYLTALMGASTRPSILLSYLVTKPKQGNYNGWVSERSGMRDIDPSDWDRWCEYILYKGMRRAGYARISRSTITDTELQVGKFVVGEPEGTPVIEVREGMTFLDLSVRQIEHLNSSHNVNVPFILMNSFNTDDDTARVIQKYANHNVEILTFNQSRYPRVNKESLLPCPRSATDNKNLWYPPGHGDLFDAMNNSGLLDRLIAAGKEYLFVSNVDNLGADVDLNIYQHMIDTQAEFISEVTDKTKADVKGGTLIDYEGTIRLLEIAQVPSEHVEDFKSIKKFKIFNTNNLWLNLRAVKRVLENEELDLEIIVNNKALDSGEAVIQLETAVGAAIKHFRGAKGVNVPRSRFLPVKSCSDLLLITSDLYSLEHGKLLMNPGRMFSQTPVVKLGDTFKKVAQFQKRFKSIPEMIELDHLTVQGDVVFGRNITLRGTVIIVANEGNKIEIPEGSVLENKLISGNLAIIDH